MPQTPEEIKSRAHNPVTLIYPKDSGEEAEEGQKFEKKYIY